MSNMTQCQYLSIFSLNIERLPKHMQHFYFDCFLVRLERRLFFVVLHMIFNHFFACSNIRVGINHHNIQCIYISVPHGCGNPIDEKRTFSTLYHGSGDIYTAHQYKCHTEVCTVFFAKWRKHLSIRIVILHHTYIQYHICHRCVTLTLLL